MDERSLAEQMGGSSSPQVGRKRSIVLAPFFSAEIDSNRPMAVARVLAEMGPVDVVTTDFDHAIKTKKKSIQAAPIDKIVYLRTLPYRTNVSLARFLSHGIFSLRAALYFRKHRHQYEIVYASVPFNLLAWLVFCSARTQFKIVDVIDIWPDVLPFPNRLVKVFRPLFALWRRSFNLAVTKADAMMAVSDSFFAEASKSVKAGCWKRRFYIGAVRLQADVAKESILTIAYIGNIGRLYDFETLLDEMTEAERGSVQLFIVGEGDRREWLLHELDQRGLAYKYFGVVYDSKELGYILCRAHIGFNGFVDTSVAFSYKATTYLSAGLPILNSLPGDLRKLVDDHGIGVNYTACDRDSLRQCFKNLKESNCKTMSLNSERFFAAELEREKLHQEMLRFLQMGC